MKKTGLPFLLDKEIYKTLGWVLRGRNGQEDIKWTQPDFAPFKFAGR